MKILLAWVLIFSTIGCGTMEKKVKTVDKVDINQFMGSWYVLAGRFTYFEKDVHNGVETYTWNQKKERIDVDFTYNKGGFDGPKKSIPQKAWVYNQETKSHWKVSPMWPAIGIIFAKTSGK